MIKKLALSSLMLACFGANATVDYKIDLTKPDHHVGKVTMTLPAGSEMPSVMMPAWRTGKYKILDLANGVRHFKATDSKGNELAFDHTDKATWVIENPSKSEITISYTVYANDLGTRTRHIDDSHAYLDATGVFMYDPKRRKEDIRVTLDVPETWKSYAGMERTGAHQFVADNYDVLVDSPIETGISQVFDFKEDGKDYQLVIWGEGNYDAPKMAKDLQQMVKSSQNIWQGYPFDNYVFMVHATTDARGATEHLNSTVIQRKRFTFAPRKQYLSFLNTAAHEFVHTWNVKAYRPKGVAEYDYQRENYTDLLWVSEGSTSYFQEHLLQQSKLMKQKEFFDILARRIDGHIKKPGRKVQSVAASSHESWIALPGDFATNNSVNIYSEGYMASLAMDFQLLSDSGLKAGYSELHGELFKRHRLPKPFNSQDMKKIAFDLTGKSYEKWWQQNIDSPLTIDFDKLLAKAGLEFVYPKTAKEISTTGFSSYNKDGLLTLSRVYADSAAWKAGLNTGDQIVAINGLKVTQGSLKTRLAQYKVGEEVTLSLFRRDRLVEKTLTLTAKKDKKPMIRVVKNPTNKQKAFYKAWRGVELEVPKKK
ncbi:PDZ domain-containing protein [Psychrobium sp. MM17-31]|uniref:M61 family metallopeptidase n=1 Tax=Psychrobium sp. MM17-31 TaxID=2917758 RepID=UPI001EF54A1F|nr:PDZ domain-containing protein [Psychrobium sp. MM17-31]MCG7531252.1 PDZ domain-containing protein [Psychrobium sp. MM17-31]